MDFLTKDLLLKKRTSFSFLFGSNKPTFALHNDSLDDQTPRCYDLTPQKQNETTVMQNEPEEEDEESRSSTRQELSPELEAQVRYACSLLVYRIEQGISSNYCPDRARGAARKKRVSAVTAPSAVAGSSAAAAAQVDAKYLLSSTTKKLRSGMMGRLGGGLFARDGAGGGGGEKYDSGVGLTQQPSIATMREGQRSKLGSSHSDSTTMHRVESSQAGKSEAATAPAEESMIVSPISPTAPEGEEDVIISPITVSTTTTESESTVYRTVPTSLSPTDSSNNATSSEDTSPTSSVDQQFLTRGAMTEEAPSSDTKQRRRDQDTAAFLSPTDSAPTNNKDAYPDAQDEHPDLANDSDVEVFLDPDTAADYITSSAGGVGGVGPGGVGASLLTTSTPSLGLSATTNAASSARHSRVFNPATTTTTSEPSNVDPAQDTAATKRHSTYTPTYPTHLHSDGTEEPPTIIDTNGNAHIMTSAEELERDLGLQQAVMAKMTTGSVALLPTSPSADQELEPEPEPERESERELEHERTTEHPPPKADQPELASHENHLVDDATTTTLNKVPAHSDPSTLPRPPEPAYPRRPGTSASRLKTSWSALSRSTASVSSKLKRRFFRRGAAAEDDDDDSVLEVDRHPRAPTTLLKRLAGWWTGRGVTKGRGRARTPDEEGGVLNGSSSLEGVVPYLGT